jgi:hypothetical protein
MRLALNLGKLVCELDEKLTRTDLLEWIAFSRLHPFGDELTEMRTRAIRMDINYWFRQLCHVFSKVMTGNGNAPRGEDINKFEIYEYHGLKKRSGNLQEMSREELDDYLRAFTASMGGKVEE